MARKLERDEFGSGCPRRRALHEGLVVEARRYTRPRDDSPRWALFVALTRQRLCRALSAAHPLLIIARHARAGIDGVDAAWLGACFHQLGRTGPCNSSIP